MTEIEKTEMLRVIHSLSLSLAELSEMMVKTAEMLNKFGEGWNQE
jgi:hypothetical protein